MDEVIDFNMFKARKIVMKNPFYVYKMEQGLDEEDFLDLIQGIDSKFYYKTLDPQMKQFVDGFYE